MDQQTLILTRTETASSEASPWWKIGIAPDRARYHPPGEVFDGGNYTRLVVEFDDQGASYDERQLEWVQNELEALKDRKPIILVFAHGWKHNARSRDENLQAIDTVLEQTSKADALEGSNRPVVGIFIGWRGLSFYAGWLTNLTFWNRKTAALRVALGSVRELFARLKHFKETKARDATVVIVGHSFGGLLVYSAMAQGLLELALLSGPDNVAPSFANLVLLVNPAFEAARYLPVFSLIEKKRFTKQPPIMISITAANDRATGWAFPVGAWLGSLFESKGRNSRQRDAVLHTMGHLKWMRTHEVTYDPTAKPEDAMNPSGEQLTDERVTRDPSYRDRTQGWARHFPGGAVLTHKSLDPENPFWVASASSKIIDHHNGIFQPPFIGFVRMLIAEQLRKPEDAGGAPKRPSS
jgi:hypothetical protein